MKSYFICLFLLILSASIYCLTSKKRPKARVTLKKAPKHIDPDPFELLSDYLWNDSRIPSDNVQNNKGYNIRNYPQRRVTRILRQLSQSQAAVKSMDGASHAFGNTFQDKSSLTARFKRFIKSRRKTPKEAAKVMEYVSTVESALFASEILQSISFVNAKKRENALNDTGVDEIKRISVEDNGISLVVSVLRPRDPEIVPLSNSSHFSDSKLLRKSNSTPKKYAKNEFIIAITESSTDLAVSIPNLLRCMKEDPLELELRSSGFLSESVCVQPTMLRLAWKILHEVKDYIIPRNHQSSTSDNSSMLSSDTNSCEINVNLDPDGLRSSNATNYNMPSNIQLPSKLRFLGYSTGGSVAAIACMIVDGSFNITTLQENDTSCKFQGLYSGRTRCITIASPPTISRSLVPRNIYSIICGDDIVPRCYPHSLSRLHRRVEKILKSGGGRGGFASWTAGTSWISDITSVAGKSLQEYAAGTHDLNKISSPGRVFFVKSRKLKNGATIQRVMRGNWREDMLWLLHEIMLSKKMIKHHTLDYYIQTLARC